MHGPTSHAATPFSLAPASRVHGMGLLSGDPAASLLQRSGGCRRHAHPTSTVSVRDPSERTTSAHSMQCSTDLGESLHCSSLASLMTSRSGASGRPADGWPATLPGQLHVQPGNTLRSHDVPSSKRMGAMHTTWQGNVAQHSSRSMSSFGRSSAKSSTASVTPVAPRLGQSRWKDSSGGASDAAGSDQVLATFAIRSKRRIAAYPVQVSLGSVSTASIAR